MNRFEGVESFGVPLANLFAKLTDAAFLVKAMPDAEVIESSADCAAWKLKPRLSFMSGTLETTLTVAERTPTSMAKYVIVGKGVGASSTLAATLNFSATEAGSRVNWTGEIIALTGLLKLVPKGLIQSAAEKVIADVWTAVHQSV
jgi:carbon monoxide dehydrogenase subunit G